MSLVVAPTAASRNVTFRTDDGVTLAGTWYEPSARAGPAVDPRAHAPPVASRLGRIGDRVGVGRHRCAGVRSARTRRIDRHDPARRSVRAFSAGSRGRAAIRRQPRRRDPSQGWRCSARRSAPQSPRSMRPRIPVCSRWRCCPRRPSIAASVSRRLEEVLGACAAGRTATTIRMRQRSARDLDQAPGSNPSTRETLALHHAGHGTAMLAADPTLVPALVDWFKRTL